jgi:hypothetical protein
MAVGQPSAGEVAGSASSVKLKTPMKYLGIYLNDQLALGVGWRELARRAAGANRGTPLGGALAEVARQIAEDVATFEQIMERLDVPKSRAKVAGAVVAERFGRLKLNGSLTSYSPLSRFAELEFLVMGITGKIQLWQTLRDLAGLGERLPDVDFDALVARAEAQRQLLEPFRREAGEVLRR